MAVTTATILVHANKFDSAILEIVRETEKAYQVRNIDCKRQCWIPKAGLKPYKPGVATYENEYVVASWFWAKMDLTQEKVLNIAE